MKSLMKTVLDNDWSGLKQTIESKAASLIKKKVDEKKVDVLSNLNGITREQMEEVMAVTNNDTESGDV
ncbi:unnamed protein product [marine sediment metagenome]|uniref:Uncharacterized protein n=1 Tax=marine sediment metagenome TaxID=412755 RepID=X0T581_9ZZZZ